MDPKMFSNLSQNVILFPKCGQRNLRLYCRLLLLLKHRSSALKTLAFLCKASQSVCCSEFSHNLTIWVYCENMRYFSASSNKACLKRVRGQQSDDVSKKILCRGANNIKSEEELSRARIIAPFMYPFSFSLLVFDTAWGNFAAPLRVSCRVLLFMHK